MDHIPEEDAPAVARAAHAAVQEAIAVDCRCAQEVREIGADPNSTRCSARLTAGGDVPAAPDRRLTGSGSH
jgi:hypothetical protein